MSCHTCSSASDRTVLQVEEVEADYDPDFLRHIYPRLEWAALREAAHIMGAPSARHVDSRNILPRSAAIQVTGAAQPRPKAIRAYAQSPAKPPQGCATREQRLFSWCNAMGHVFVRHAGESNLPEEVTEGMLKDDEEFLRTFHHALLELMLEEGALVCPETGRRFPVHKGVPNLLLHEDEI